MKNNVIPRGSALILTIVVLAVLGISTTLMFLRTQTNKIITGSAYRETRAFQAAQTGLNVAAKVVARAYGKRLSTPTPVPSSFSLVTVGQGDDAVTGTNQIVQEGTAAVINQDIGEGDPVSAAFSVTLLDPSGTPSENLTLGVDRRAVFGLRSVGSTPNGEASIVEAYYQLSPPPDPLPFPTPPAAVSVCGGGAVCTATDQLFVGANDDFLSGSDFTPPDYLCNNTGFSNCAAWSATTNPSLFGIALGPGANVTLRSSGCPSGGPAGATANITGDHLRCGSIGRVEDLDPEGWENFTVAAMELAAGNPRHTVLDLKKFARDVHGKLTIRPQSAGWGEWHACSRRPCNFDDDEEEELFCSTRLDPSMVRTRGILNVCYKNWRDIIGRPDDPRILVIKGVPNTDDNILKNSVEIVEATVHDLEFSNENRTIAFNNYGNGIIIVDNAKLFAPSFVHAGYLISRGRSLLRFNHNSNGGLIFGTVMFLGGKFDDNTGIPHIRLSREGALRAQASYEDAQDPPEDGRPYDGADITRLSWRHVPER